MSSDIHYQPHYTVDDYRRWEGQWELWFGTAVAILNNSTKTLSQRKCCYWNSMAYAHSG